MARHAIACSLALLGLAACSTYQEPPPMSSGVPYTTVLPVGDYRPGFGTLESIALQTPPAESASAGGTSGAAASGPYRLTLRMDDGSTQTLVHNARAFLVGDRLQVTADGKLIRP
jgi:hypothetical protein